ncbi:hypothetical protein [Klebsiella sp. 2680]|uniref:hypothetical protein n=1 Tax=Klebsiella sp. 2680 TaxID=2018037 RepID=UPI0011572E2B|nr:hypothetical protein [Klebsiella sp. 2680]
MVNILTPLKHQASPCLLGYGSELSTRLRFYAVSFICVEFIFGRFWRKFDVADSHLGLSSDSFALEVQMNLSLLPPSGPVRADYRTEQRSCRCAPNTPDGLQQLAAAPHAWAGIGL